MTPIELVDGLVAFIQSVVSEYDLTTKVQGKSKTPSVYAGYLPPPDDEDEEDGLTPKDYPFVVVRFLSDTDNLEMGDTVQVRILIGTHSEDEQNGWRDALNIATRIKIFLRKEPTIGPFTLTDKIQIDLFEEQLRPFWHVIMDLSYLSPQVQPEWREMFHG